MLLFRFDIYSVDNKCLRLVLVQQFEQFINGYRKAVTKILCPLHFSYHHKCGNNINSLFMITPRSFSVALEAIFEIYNLELQVRF
jgi:hypothetical protein